jgi:probable H4MPT-linked C1 transfer pathway protein
MTFTAGLDVGGAHLKVALAENGHVTAVRQIACPLWQGLDRLDAALAEARPLLDAASHFAVTMTGELSDLFPDRETGVATRVSRLSQELGPDVRFWMGRRGFGTASEARLHHTSAGSTNFLASATLIGEKLRDALLIDFGSTTADIVSVKDGVPVPRGLVDAERQATGELVYTGFTRTAVMAVASRAPFRGQWVSLAREYLATMADVRRILDIERHLADFDQHATADGKGKSELESVTRLARMLGRDGIEATIEEWRGAAASIREEQLRSLHDGVHQVLSHATLSSEAPVVVAGIGASDAATVALRCGRSCIAFGDLVEADDAYRVWATACAPAVAVALLSSSR